MRSESIKIPRNDTGMTTEELLGIKEKATEETLQSIDDTLKRIETVFTQLQNRFCVSSDSNLQEPKST